MGLPSSSVYQVNFSPIAALSSILISGVFFAGCAVTRNNKVMETEAGATQAPTRPVQTEAIEEVQEAELNRMVSRLQKKIAVLEERLTAMDARIESTRVGLENIAKIKNPTEGIVAPAAQGAGRRVQPSEPRSSGFSQSPAVQNYREGLIFYRSGKFDDAIIKFSEFIQNFPDHVLAGAAQFHLGEAYFKRGEYELAASEYKRVLVSYDKSSYVPDALGRLVQTGESLNREDEAEVHRNQLLTLFPQSPAARELMATKVSNVSRQTSMGESTDPARFVAESDNQEMSEPPPTAPLPGALDEK